MWNTQITKTLSLRKRHHLGGGQERIDKQHAKGKMTRWNGSTICWIRILFMRRTAFSVRVRTVHR